MVPHEVTVLVWLQLERTRKTQLWGGEITHGWSNIGLVVVVTVCFTVGALAQEATAGSTGKALQEQTSVRTPQAGSVYVPESSRKQPGRFHTTYVLRSTDGKKLAGLSAPIEWAGQDKVFPKSRLPGNRDFLCTEAAPCSVVSGTASCVNAGVCLHQPWLIGRIKS